MSKVKPDALADFIQRISGEAQDAREKLADDFFALPRVAEQMSAEAVKGFTSVTLTPPRLVDLQDTEAARVLVKLLTSAGATCEWRKRYTAGSADGSAVLELLISWLPKNLRN